MIDQRIVKAVGTSLFALSLGACTLQQVSESVGSAAKFLNDPVVQDILNKVVVPLVPLDSAQLKPLLDKTFSAARIIELYQSTLGARALELPRGQLKQVDLEGPNNFGILTTDTVGLGDKGATDTFDQLKELIFELFGLKAKRNDVDPTAGLPPVYANSSSPTTTISPTQAPTEVPTPTPTLAPTQAPTQAPTTGSTSTPTPTSKPTSAPTPEAPVVAPGGTFPGRVDLRQKFGKARSQGQRGTCNLFAMAQLLDYYYPERGEHSPEFLDWLYNFNYRARNDEERNDVWNVDQGTYTHVLIALLTPQGNPVPSSELPYIPPAQGAPKESDAPYQRSLGSSDPQDSADRVAPLRLGAGLAERMKGGVALQTDLLQLYELKLDLATLKGALAEQHPIRISYPCKDSDWQSQQTLRNRNFRIADLPRGTSESEARHIGYHAVLAVGFEDDGAAEGGGWFLIRNSWGENWGDKGYAWISYQMTLDFAHSPTIGKPVKGQNVTTFSTRPLPDEPPTK